MARSILSKSVTFRTRISLLKSTSSPAGISSRLPCPIRPAEAVLAACKRADEIYVNAELPSSLYRWEVMPKVAKRYQGNMVSQAARERVGADTPIHVQWKPVADVVEGGRLQNQDHVRRRPGGGPESLCGTRSAVLLKRSNAFPRCLWP